ncbi:hypothetical protein [Massilia timonae]|uniref:hypothetical protein n=1 Tax=Massilia timonae TaxID=47229 RepID=UPI0028D1FFC2|nr:hypothetical protein [Massilia timonae]
MAFVLKKLNKLPVKVKGALPDEDGKAINFDFTLHCKRKTQDEIDDVMKDKKSAVKEFVREVAEGWDGVLDAGGNAVPFANEELDELLDNPGLPLLIMHAYLEQVSATAKN